MQLTVKCLWKVYDNDGIVFINESEKSAKCSYVATVIIIMLMKIYI